MKIKSIVAGVAAAGTLALSSVAFAVAPDEIADDAAVEDEVVGERVDEAADEIVDDDALLGENAAEITPEDIAAKLSEIYGDEQINAMFDRMRAEIEEADGVESIVASAMEQFNTFAEAAKADPESVFGNSVSEEEIAVILEQLDAVDTEQIEVILTGVYTALEESGDPYEFITSVLSDCSDDMLQSVAAAVDIAAQLGAGFDVTDPGTNGDLSVDDGADGADGADGTEGGDNVDTGVEGVAAVIGIVAVAGAAVVISRKRT